MTRPSKSGEGDSPRISVRLDARLVERLDEQAARRSVEDGVPVTRSDVIEAALLAAFPVPHPRPLIEVLADEPYATEASREVAGPPVRRKPKAAKPCDHPKADRKVLGYATLCGKCGVRVR